MKPRQLINRLFHRTLLRLDGAARASSLPFDRPDMMVPHLDSKFYGWTHYGVMIPDLPEPHRFFSIMSIIGTPGALAFDTDHALRDIPRRNATVVSGTAATHPAWFGSYSVDRECRMTPDGSRVCFGQEVEIIGRYPEYRVRAHWEGFDAEFTVRNTDTVSWFVKNPVYEHFSLLSQYEGEFTAQGRTISAAGMCTFEYGACISPYNSLREPLPPALKVPLDFFSYSILNIDSETQLLLSDVRLKGLPVQLGMHERRLDGSSAMFPDLELTVLEYAAEPAIAPDGVRMRLPSRLLWRVRDKGRVVLELHATVDTPLTYGLGSGYVGGYRAEGEYRGKPVRCRGYLEYVDRREG